jgi:hypothetical protein
VALALIAAVGLGVAHPRGFEELRSQLQRPKRVDSLEATRRIDAGFEAEGQRKAIRLLDRDVRPSLVATGAIGSIGYYSRLPILDLFGLTDAEIARQWADTPDGSVRISGHQRSHAEYVMRRAPDYILIPRRKGTPETWNHLIPAVEDLWAHPALDRDYVWDQKVGGYRRRAGVE